MVAQMNTWHADGGTNEHVMMMVVTQMSTWCDDSGGTNEHMV
jgi:hypothetical protein